MSQEEVSGGLPPSEDDISDGQWLRVSYSSMNVFDSCARKFEFQKFYQQPQVAFENFAADVGTSIHKGYQNFLVHGDVDRALWEYLKSYPYASEFMQDKDDRSCEAGFATLEEMFASSDMAEWELATIRRPDGEEVPAIEVPFELRFKGLSLPGGVGIAFTGFMDALMFNRMTGRYRTLDIKTHRRYMREATAKYKFDSQQLPYGVIVEHLQGHAVEGFDVLYLDCFVDVVEPRVQLYSFEKSREDVHEWLTYKVLQFQQLQRYMELEFFPRVDSGCMAWNKPCFFLDVCQTRNREAAQAFLLAGEEPYVREYEQPWIVAEIDLFAGAAS